MMSDPRDTDLDDELEVEPNEDLVNTDDDDVEDDADLDDALEDTFPASDPLPPPTRPGT